MPFNLDYETICRSDKGTLERLLSEGFAPALESLRGWEFRGYNVNPGTAILGFRKFKKGFFADPDNSTFLKGYNVKVVQNCLQEPWVEKRKDGNAIRHSYYEVYPVRAAGPDNLYLNSLFLNYGIAGKPVWDPSCTIRDYLVQVSEKNENLLLGKAYVALGSVRIVGGFFVLERHNEIVA
ncbi:MAG: hypothetical protein V1754_06550 [Pseudomonadota bacterium]